MKILGNDVVSQEEFDTFKSRELANLQIAVSSLSTAVDGLQNTIEKEHVLTSRVIYVGTLLTAISFVLMGILWAK